MYYVLLDINTPMITDWISSIAAFIGVPLAIWSFRQLIIKDKDKQRQLNDLTTIAQKQTELVQKLEAQIVQLTKQTVEFQEQTLLMAEALNVDKERFAAEKESLLVTYRAEFIPYEANPGETMPSLNEIYFRNTGNIAYDLSVKFISGDNLGFSLIDPRQVIKKNAVLRIKLDTRIKGVFNGNTTFIVYLIFSDNRSNYYKQTITRGNSRLNVAPPEKYLETL